MSSQNIVSSFKYTKFRTADDTSYIIRDAISHTGCPVIFKVSGYDLSILASERILFDFDIESDKILESLEVSLGTEQVYFEWVGRSFHRI